MLTKSRQLFRKQGMNKEKTTCSTPHFFGKLLNSKRMRNQYAIPRLEGNKQNNVTQC